MWNLFSCIVEIDGILHIICAFYWCILCNIFSHRDDIGIQCPVSFTHGRWMRLTTLHFLVYGIESQFNFFVFFIILGIHFMVLMVSLWRPGG